MSSLILFQTTRLLKKAQQLDIMTQKTRNKSQELTGFIDTVHTTIKGIMFLRYFHFITKVSKAMSFATVKVIFTQKMLQFAQGM